MGKQHGEWVVAHELFSAQHGMPQAQGLGLADVEAMHVRGLDASNDLEQTGLAPRPTSASISYDLSKWSSIAPLPRPVTKIISVIPAAMASSTAYWIKGLS